jgi:hypothetical protein
MGRIRRELVSAVDGVGRAPLPVRFAIVAALAFGLLGALAGLVLGLVAHPPTAWFAVLEVGVPAALLGALAGLMVGSATALLRRA